VLAAVGEARAANASASVALLGFSLGAAVAQLAALDVVCSGVAPAGLVSVYAMGGPGFCSGDACAATYDALQAQGLVMTRVVNVFDLIPWLPAFLYEPPRTPRGQTMLSFTSAGQFLLAAHSGRGYLASLECASLRALAWLPFAAAAVLAAACAAADARVRAAEQAPEDAAAASAALSVRGAEGDGGGGAKAASRDEGSATVAPGE
jgi:hypothetical protein